MREQSIVRMRRGWLLTLAVSLGAALALGDGQSALAKEDCGKSRKKLAATKKKAARLQAKLRKLLVAPSQGDAEKAQMTKVQAELGVLSDQRHALESALKGCKGGAKAKAKKAGKKPTKAKPKKKLAKPVPEPVAEKEAPEAPPPAPVATPAPEATTAPAASLASPGSTAASAPLTGSAAPVSMPPEPVCSGGPAASSDGDGDGPRVAPPPLTSWRSRLERHAANRRAVDWAAESPHRCAAGTIARGAP